jgi:peptidyl-prolyl cis-trans isomerase A (cyclophilin A)
MENSTAQLARGARAWNARAVMLTSPPLAKLLGAAAALVTLASLGALACSSSSSKAAAITDAGDEASAAPVSDASAIVDVGAPPPLDAGPDLLSGCTRDPGPIPPAFDPTSKKDPLAGAFSLDQAMAGFPAGSGALTVAIYTEAKGIKCTLDAANAPISVANFIGLARGTRPYKLGLGKPWQVGRFYDGLTWHRVIPDFMIQGGDPLGDGTGGPDYDLPVENQVAEPLGTLAMASGAKPSGSQLFIVTGQGPAPEYNVFGTCTTDVAIALSNVPRDDGGTDMPITPVHLLRVDIARCP